MKTVTATIRLLEGAGNNTDVWRFVHSVLTRLGASGMSSDETDHDDRGRPRFRVSIIAWRRDIDEWLDAIDGEGRLDGDDDPYVLHAGAKPVPRMRSEGNRVSERFAVQGLPRSFYDDAWYSEQGDTEDVRRLRVNLSLEEFQWLQATPSGRMIKL